MADTTQPIVGMPPPLPTDAEKAFLGRKEDEQTRLDYQNAYYAWNPDLGGDIPQPPSTLSRMASDVGQFFSEGEFISAPLIGLAELGFSIAGMLGITDIPRDPQPQPAQDGSGQQQQPQDRRPADKYFKSETGKMAEAVTPYIFANIPAIWGAKAVAAAGKLGPKATTLLMMAGSAVGDFGVGATVEDPNDPNAPAKMILHLADFADDSKVKPVLEWLAGNEDESALEKRMKRGLQEGATNVVGETMMLGKAGVGYLKRLREQIKSGQASVLVDKLRAFGQGWERQADAMARENPELADKIWSDQVGSVAPDIAARKGAVKLADAIEKIAVWHGGPNQWMPEPGFPNGRPRLDRIGTGEGAQAYGWGFYVAERKGVADSYRMAGSPAYQSSAVYQLVVDAMDMAEKKGLSGEAAKTEARNILSRKAETMGASKQVYYDAANNLPELINNPPGALFKLDIPKAEVDKFLDWDKPLNEQPANVQGALKSLAQWPEIEQGTKYWKDPPTGKDIYRMLASNFGNQFMKEGQMGASEALRAAGIPGLRYLDQGSRGAGDGTRNLVIWDQNLLDRMSIIEKNGKPIKPKGGK